jgi:hypothetical protein
MTPEVTQPQTEKRWTGILLFFGNNPVIGLLGTIASVVGVVLAVLFYIAASKARELSFYVNPTTTTIVRSGQSSDLYVLYKGQPVSTDVTAFQLEVWNAGKEPIRTEHILDPIVIETSPRVPILDL